MLSFQHICINANDYEAAMRFYCGLLGLRNVKESYSENKKAVKIELHDDHGYVIELFVNADWPKPDSINERRRGQLMTGFDHLSFYVEDPDARLAFLKENGVEIIPAKIDVGTGKKYGFAFSPEGLRIEFYEA